MPFEANTQPSPTNGRPPSCFSVPLASSQLGTLRHPPPLASGVLSSREREAACTEPQLHPPWTQTEFLVPHLDLNCPRPKNQQGRSLLPNTPFTHYQHFQPNIHPLRFCLGRNSQIIKACNCYFQPIYTHLTSNLTLTSSLHYKNPNNSPIYPL